MKLQNTVMQLRKVCSHPFLFARPDDDKWALGTSSLSLSWSWRVLMDTRLFLPSYNTLLALMNLPTLDDDDDDRAPRSFRAWRCSHLTTLAHWTIMFMRPPGRAPLTPALLAAREAELLGASGKMLLLDRLLGELFRRGHKVLLFSQFTTMLDIIEVCLSCLSYPFPRFPRHRHPSPHPPVPFFRSA
jgi:SNF2 family DNA or RNA helicase